MHTKSCLVVCVLLLICSNTAKFNLRKSQFSRLHVVLFINKLVVTILFTYNKSSLYCIFSYKKNVSTCFKFIAKQLIMCVHFCFYWFFAFKCVLLLHFVVLLLVVIDPPVLEGQTPKLEVSKSTLFCYTLTPYVLVFATNQTTYYVLFTHLFWTRNVHAILIRPIA